MLFLSMLLVASPRAKAACVIHGARPTVPLPTVVTGQEFSFIASPDCETLGFTIRGTTLSKTPRSGEQVGPGSKTYKVKLTENEWDAVVAESGATLTWIVTGRTSAGETTRLVTTNDLKASDGIEIELSTADAMLVGDEDNNVGWYPVGAGDVNGDGNDDLFVNGDRDDEAGKNAGAAYLVLGPVTGTFEVSHAHAKLLGVEPGARVGESISGAGDVNGDGLDDLLLGDRWEDEDTPLVDAAYLVLGPVSGTFDLSFADAKLEGEHEVDEAGWSVAGAGDVNADGYDDVLVGTGLRLVGSHGTAYLLHGPVTGTRDLGTADATLDTEYGTHDGTRVTGVGDANGDGNADLLIGSPYDTEAGYLAGAAYLVLGPAIGDIDLGTAADAKLLADSESDVAGHRLSWAGDVDGDGNDDLLIAASIDQEGGMLAGAAYLVLSPVTGTHSLAIAEAKLIGTERAFVGGCGVAGPGDIDSDGHDDLLIGACGVTTEVVGAAYLVTSPVSGTIELASSADVAFVVERRDHIVDAYVCGAGDVDADGRPDLLFGGAHRSDEGDRVGAAFLFYGGGL